uniref:hypothetical protein n=1 Tax=Pedobacter schmidteae TaxID=2201271 RepID=UPI000EB55E9B|nr:hypothetical protein [Pedobacter schmidteae]
MKQNRLNWTWMGIMLLVLAACSKNNENFLQKQEILPITLKGYNGSNEELLVKLDTFTSVGTISTNQRFERDEAYTFSTLKNTVKLSISEKRSGKLVLEKELKKEDKPVVINFLYMDGKVSDMPQKPEVENDKIKLSYKFIPDITGYTAPVDFVIGKYYVTPQVFEELARIKNVKPNEFSEPATISTFSTARQDYNGTMTSVSFLVRICKAGTNVPYVEGTPYTWNALSSTAPKPAASTASSKLYIFSEQPAGNIMRFSTRLDL